MDVVSGCSGSGSGSASKVSYRVVRGGRVKNGDYWNELQDFS